LDADRVAAAADGESHSRPLAAAERQQQRQPDEDAQCKIVKVILANCKSSTTQRSSSDSSCRLPSGDGGGAAVPATGQVATSTVESGISTSAEAATNVREVPPPASGVMVDHTSSGGTVAAPSSLGQTSCSSAVSVTPVLTLSSLRLNAPPPLNGVASQLPLALGQRLQLLGQPSLHSLPSVSAAAGQRWPVPLVNNPAAAGGAWLTLQPMTSVAPSFGLIPPAQGASTPTVPRAPLPVDQPGPSGPETHPSIPAHAALINSPIKQFLDHTRSVPALLPSATGDVPTDLSMKTLRRLEENATSGLPLVAAPAPTEDDDAPLDLCTKRPTLGASHKRPPDVVENVPTTKTPQVRR